MITAPPRATLTDTLVCYTTLFRSGRASRRRAPSASAPARRLRRPCSCRAVPTNEALEFLQHVAHGSAGERDGMLGGQEVTFERCADQVDDRSGLLQQLVGAVGLRDGNAGVAGG